jgi:hypothetical protein
VSFRAAEDPHRHLGDVFGNGHCVAFVRELTGLGPTTTWRRGDPVRGSGAATLTAIATFNPTGRYTSHVDKSSHCAILLAEQPDGLLVIDQWVGEPVRERVIRFQAGAADAANDGDRFYLIEIA